MINHESFPGSDLTTLECDGLVSQFVPLNLLLEEASLYRVKHWDYRFLHPVHATQLFAHSYAQAKKHAVERRTDIWVGRNMRGIKNDIIFNLDARSITGFWKGRQMADRMGIPYDFYCEAAMLFADVARWENLPTAIQLYSDNVPEHLRQTDYAVSMITYIGGRWLDRLKTSLTYATHKAYLIENYQGGIAQNAYLNYLGDKIRESAHPAAVLSCALDKGQLDHSMVRKLFPRSCESLIYRAEDLRC